MRSSCAAAVGTPATAHEQASPLDHPGRPRLGQRAFHRQAGGCCLRGLPSTAGIRDATWRVALARCHVALAPGRRPDRDSRDPGPRQAPGRGFLVSAIRIRAVTHRRSAPGHAVRRPPHVPPVALDSRRRRMARERAANQEAASAPDWSAERLGRKLRELRTARGLRLSDLASASGLSVSFLSQVEQGQSDIAVGRLMRTAHALEVRLTDLVELPQTPARPLVRAGERAILPAPTEGLTIELLADSL